MWTHCVGHPVFSSARVISLRSAHPISLSISSAERVRGGVERRTGCGIVRITLFVLVVETVALMVTVRKSICRCQAVTKVLRALETLDAEVRSLHLSSLPRLAAAPAPPAFALFVSSLEAALGSGVEC